MVKVFPDVRFEVLPARDRLPVPLIESSTHQATTVLAESTARAGRGKWFLRITLLFIVATLAICGRTWWNQFQTHRYLAACQTARGEQDWRREREIADRWVAWNPETDMGWWCAAEASQNLQDYAAMARYLGNVPPSDPKYPLALVEKANLEWTSLNKPLDAVGTSELILEIDPEIVEVQSRLISYYAMTLQRVPMLKTIRHAMANHAQSREAFVYYIMADMLSYTNGASMNSRWLAALPDEPRFKIALGIHTAMTLAMNVDASRTDESVELDQEANRQLDWFLESHPHDVSLLTYMMHRAYQSGDVKRVGELLQSAPNDVVEDHMIWVYRAWYHHSLNELPEAEESIQEAVKLHSVSPLARHEYAVILRKMGRLSEAENHQQLASEGRELRTRLLTSPNASEIDASILIDIAKYAKRCGDQLAFDSLVERLEYFGHSVTDGPEKKMP